MIKNVHGNTLDHLGQSIVGGKWAPGDSIPPEPMLCEDLGVGDVLTTHGHRDHIQAVPAVRRAGHRVGVAQADAGMLPAHDFRRHGGHHHALPVLRDRRAQPS